VTVLEAQEAALRATRCSSAAVQQCSSAAVYCQPGIVKVRSKTDAKPLARVKPHI
jgi:hypothetical protein